MSIQLQEMINRVKTANYAYRVGEPLISDSEYDLLLEKLRPMMGIAAFDIFRKTLTEPKGDVAHKYIIGSLDKIKADDVKALAKFIQGKQSIYAAAKVDGMSYVATYEKGCLVHGETRGDGYHGKDITNKLLYILPRELPQPATIDVRGELTFTGSTHEQLGFTSRRAGIVGLIGRDNASPEHLRRVRALTYQILNANFAIPDQYTMLSSLGFMLPIRETVPIIGDVAQSLSIILRKFKNSADYDMDGLVLFGLDTLNEKEFYPKNMVAFKLDADPVFTVVKDIEWTISKGGLLKPVVLVETVSIDNTNVSRVTGYNAAYIQKNGIGVGAEVGIIKSGDIIPKIVKVIKEAKVALPRFCPSCTEPLNFKGVELACGNPDCGASELMKTASFLEKMNVEGVSEVSLNNWGINRMEDLIDFRSDGSSSQDKFVAELENKIFAAQEETIFAAMYFDGMGRKTVGKLLSLFGDISTATCVVENIVANINVGTMPQPQLPSGIGIKTIQKAHNDWVKNRVMLDKIVKSIKYTGHLTQQVVSGKLSGKSFLFTGTLSMVRKEAESLVRSNGGEIASSVSKNLHYLVVGTDAGSKLAKAQKLGITILTESEFQSLVE